MPCGSRGNVRVVRRVSIVVAAIVAMLTVPASGAVASSYSRILKTYEREGTVPPCAFTSAQLSNALRGVDTYGAQYFADFTDAINSALAARASGQCVSRAVQAQTAATDIGGRVASRPLHVGSLTAPTSAGVPLPILLLAAIATAIAAVMAVAGIARVRGWDPAWVAGWRHAWGEAGYRTDGAWAGFVDWLRSAR
jgi:hypothetical protein